MKKVLIILLAFVLLFALVSCSNTEQKSDEEAPATAENSPEELDPIGYNYEIPQEIYSTPASENGLGGSYYVLDGHLEAFMSAQEFDPSTAVGSECYAEITTAEGNKIVLYNIILPTPDASEEKYQKMVDKDVRVWFEYQGFSEVHDVAMGALFFMTDDVYGFDDEPIELIFDLNAAASLESLAYDQGLPITFTVSDYSGVDGVCEYTPGMDTDAVTEEFRTLCTEFLEKQGLWFGAGSLTFTQNGKEIALYDVYPDNIDKVR